MCVIKIYLKTEMLKVKLNVIHYIEYRSDKIWNPARIKPVSHVLFAMRAAASSASLLDYLTHCPCTIFKSDARSKILNSLRRLTHFRNDADQLRVFGYLIFDALKLY
jgi:hypothetical protein